MGTSYSDSEILGPLRIKGVELRSRIVRDISMGKPARCVRWGGGELAPFVRRSPSP